VGAVPKSNRAIVETGKVDTPNTQVHDRSLSWLDTPNTQIHDRSLSWLDTCTLITRGSQEPVSLT
jgi:hypothetical protein